MCRKGRMGCGADGGWLDNRPCRSQHPSHTIKYIWDPFVSASPICKGSQLSMGIKHSKYLSRLIVRLLFSPHHSLCLHGTGHHCVSLPSHSSSSSNASFLTKQPPAQSVHSFAHPLSSISFILPFVQLAGSRLVALLLASSSDRPPLVAQKGTRN